jgi:hypothetical protein
MNSRWIWGALLLAVLCAPACGSTKQTAAPAVSACIAPTPTNSVVEAPGPTSALAETLAPTNAVAEAPTQSNEVPECQVSANEAPEAPPQKGAVPEFRVRHRPPRDRDVYEAVLASGAVRLVDPECVNAGRDETDVTVGAYLSNFISKMNGPRGGNHIEVERVETTAKAWIVRAMFGHAEGSNEWSWGIEFAIRRRDGSVDQRSFRCIGAG